MPTPLLTLTSLLRPKGHGAHRFDGDGGRVTVATLRRRDAVFDSGEAPFGDPSLQLFGAQEYLRHHPIHNR